MQGGGLFAAAAATTAALWLGPFNPWATIGTPGRLPGGGPVGLPGGGLPGGPSAGVQRQVAGLNYKLFVPEGLDPDSAVPLVVMLHGCTQDPDQFATGTKMNVLAKEKGFLVAYPDQPPTANGRKCWNWFLPEHQSRGSGEPAAIAAIPADVAEVHPVDPDRIYVAGLSAGGAMAVILGATYPDRFAAIAVHSGLEYQAARDVFSAACPPLGFNPNGATCKGGPPPNQQGDRAFAAMGPQARVVSTIVFHGIGDDKVFLVNAHQIVSQWAQTNDRASDGADDDNIDDVAELTQPQPPQVSGGLAFTRQSYNDATTGQTVIDLYLVEGMGHAWSGGDPAGSHTDRRGPGASSILWEFFASHPRPAGPV